MSLGPRRPWFDDGRVNIVPINPRTYEQMTSEPVIPLSLLRTCSQIHLEARNVLWRHNSLALAQPSTLYSHSRFLDPKFCYGVQSVQLSMDMMTSRNLQASLGGALKIFDNWARQGSLRSLTLTMFLGAQRGMRALEVLVQFWVDHRHLQHARAASSPVATFFENMGRLKEAGETLPKQLRRRIVFDTDWDVLPLVSKRDWLKKREDLHPQNVIKEMHDKFGGEFWVDGKLCFKDHVEVERIFDVPPEEEVTRGRSSGERAFHFSHPKN